MHAIKSSKDRENGNLKKGKGGGKRPFVSWAQLMKSGGHPSPFAALSFSNLKKIPIYCWVGRETFPVI